MNEVDRFVIAVSGVWASVKTHDLASLLFSQLDGSPSIGLSINGSVIGNVVFGMTMMIVAIYMIRKDDCGRRTVLWLLSISLVLGLPVAVMQRLVGISAAEVIGALALGTALLAYCWTIFLWSKDIKNKIKGRFLGAAGIVILLILPIGISWAAAYTGVLA